MTKYTPSRSYPYPDSLDSVLPSQWWPAFAGPLDSDVAAALNGADTAAEALDRIETLEGSAFRALGVMADGTNWDATSGGTGWIRWTKPQLPGFSGTLPPGLTEHGVLERYAPSLWTQMQRATEANTSRMWVRTIRNPTGPVWNPWREITSAPTTGCASVISPDWLHIGDSQTDDLILGAEQWGHVLASLTGQQHELRGWWNQRAEAVGVRLGAAMYPVTVTGGSIPVSGNVTVVGKWDQQLAFGSYAGLMSRKVPGWLAGRHGVLQNPTNSGSMRFTPDDGGGPTPIAGTAWFQGDLGQYLNRIVTIQVGGNNRADTPASAVVSWIDQMVRHVQGNRILVMSVLPYGSTTYLTETTAINTALRSAFPAQFFDCWGAITDPQAAIDAGITFTSEDHDLIAQGLSPASMRSDHVHLNAAGAKALAHAVHREAVARRWVA